MTYSVQWQLVGLSERLLDSGCLDDSFDEYSAAITALDGFLRTYSEVGRDRERGYWWARRSADADLELRLWIDPKG